VAPSIRRAVSTTRQTSQPASVCSGVA
jgi:hypothetical protein